jgi:hypothetical protein
MTAARDKVVGKLWRGVDPFTGFQPALYRPEYGGWGSNHFYLADSVTRIRPTTIVEIGVWNGASSRTLAEALREQQVDGVVISIDTWLGSAEHWVGDHFKDLHCVHGYPTKQLTFMANVSDWNLTGHIVPLPLDSLNAAIVLQAYGITADIIHLDSAHDYEAVAADLRVWWPRLRSGGILIGDDYHHNGDWLGVRTAFDQFFSALGLHPFEFIDGKCRILKP